MTPAQLIARKRDGEELSESSIAEFIQQYTLGNIPEYQMSALAMAIYFQGMSTRETVALTWAMLESGIRLEWPDDPPRVDKHSTGGIGDKTSLVLAPIMACCGLQIPMLSGRGLGMTGGTLDKLESIPGFRTDLTVDEIQELTRRVGGVITGASAELVPADKSLYALRDVTATVPSIPLIIASIISKKLAESLDSLVLDVKFGSGAFMKTIDKARQLAQGLVDVGATLGLKVTALLTDMNQPLGRFVGNAVEVREALVTLSGNGPADLRELTFALGNELLLSEGVVATPEEGSELQQRIIDSGTALEKFREIVAAQGGTIARPLDIAASQELISPQTGFVTAMDNQALGLAMIQLGGGRRVMSDSIDHGVGLEVLVRVGDRVQQGQPILRLFSRPTLHVFDKPPPAEIDTTRLVQTIKIQSKPTPPLVLIHERILPEES